MTLLTIINFGLVALGSNPNGRTVTKNPIEVAEQIQWSSGTGANQANASYESETTIAPSATTTFDFAGGGLEDPFGAAIALTAIKLVYIENTGTEAIIVGGSNGMVAVSFVLRAGERVLKAAGDATAYPVAAGSSDTITLMNTSGATAAAYRIVVIGAQ